MFTIDPDVRRRAAITYCLNREGIFAEPFESITEFLQAWSRPGVVLLHDDESAVSTLTDAILHRQAWLPIVAFAANPQPFTIVEAVLDGAVGYVAWPNRGDALIKAIREASRRTGIEIGGSSRRALATARIECLSPREREILAGMAAGLSNRRIASALTISPRTVELHRANLLEKIGARHSYEAIRLAIEASLPAFDPPAFDPIV